MKTNLSNLMNIANEKEQYFSSLNYDLKSFAVNYSTQELNGTINVTEEYKADYEEAFKEFTKVQKEITKIKSAIHQKNNEFRLSDGRTIQEAIIDNTNLRKMKALYKTLLSKRGSKKRVDEYNTSYFECKTLNFDIKELQKLYDELEAKIQDTDFQISKLNSVEFEIDL